MKTLWTVIGVIVLIIILVAIYRKATTKPMAQIMPTITPAAIQTPVKNLSNNTTTKTVDTVVVQPIYIQTGADCTSQSYQDGVQALRDTYMQKRVLYQTGISTNDPNVIALHNDMNDAYNAYADEVSKCSLFQG